MFCPKLLLCYSATELKANAFQTRELLEAGYSVQELTQAGIKGKQLQALGISMDETLNAAWQQGSAAP
jgi:ribosomal protein L13E